MQSSERYVLEARLLTFFAQPKSSDLTDSYHYWPEGALAIDQGQIVWRGDRQSLSAGYEAWPRIDHRAHLVLPGFIDTHTHFPQMGVIGSYGAQLLDWLETYTFPQERLFVDKSYARREADAFLTELVANGVTTAAVYTTSHPQACEAFFIAAQSRNMRMIAGKTIMDREAPAEICDTPQRAYDESKALLNDWHGASRLSYAVTPRFAITSTPEQLELVQALVAEHPDCYVQTHLSETQQEIKTTLNLYPQARDYTEIYETYGLLGRRSLFGHCIHLSPRERAALAESGSVAVFCPSSNLFLGSGLFDYATSEKAGLRIALGSDVGAGTSYSMLTTAADAYKVCQLKGFSLTPFESFYRLTYGNAEALSMLDKVGTLDVGTEADFVVLDSKATTAMQARMAHSESLMEELFVLQTLGDDRSVAETYIAGRPSKQAQV